VDELPVGGAPTGLSVGAGAIWVASPDAGIVWRIDASATTSSALPINVGGRPAATAADDAAVWVSDTAAGTISRIDPATDDVIETIPVGNAASGVAVGAGLVWVAVQAP
jgi:YVTN family beta-propeller protein